jgi:hypothetical protein
MPKIPRWKARTKKWLAKKAAEPSLDIAQLVAARRKAMAQPMKTRPPVNEDNMIDRHLARGRVQKELASNAAGLTDARWKTVKKFLRVSEGSKDPKVVSLREKIIERMGIQDANLSKIVDKDARNKVRDTRWEPSPVKKTYGTKATMAGDNKQEHDLLRFVQATASQAGPRRGGNPEEAAEDLSKIVNWTQGHHGLLLSAAKKTRNKQPRTQEEAAEYATSRTRGMNIPIMRGGKKIVERMTGDVGSSLKRTGNIVDQVMDSATRLGKPGFDMARRLKETAPDVMDSYSGRLRSNAQSNSEAGTGALQKFLDDLKTDSSVPLSDSHKIARLQDLTKEGRAIEALPMERSASMTAAGYAAKAAKIADEDPATAWLLNRAARMLSMADQVKPKVVEAVVKQADTALAKGKRWEHPNPRDTPEGTPYNVDSDTLKPGQHYMTTSPEAIGAKSGGVSSNDAEGQLLLRFLRERGAPDTSRPPAPREVDQGAFNLNRHVREKEYPKATSSTEKYEIARLIEARRRGEKPKGKSIISESDPLKKDHAWTLPGNAEGQIPDAPRQLLFPKGTENERLRLGVDGPVASQHTMHDDEFFSVVTQETKGKPTDRVTETNRDDMRAAAKKTAENDRLVDGLKRENRKGGDNPELVEAASSIGDWMSRAEKLRMQAEGLGTPLKGTPEYIRQGVLRRRAAELTAKAKGLMREVGMTTRGEMMEMGPEEKKKLGEVGATLRRFL